MKKIKNIYLLVGFLALMFTMGCEDFLNINEDPNNPLEVPLTLLLPSIEADMASSLSAVSGGLSSQTMAYMQMTTQRGQDWNDYGFTGDDFQVITPWNVSYYRTIKDLEILLEQADAEGANHYVGVGLILKAYIYSILVDIWADVPFSEAVQGPEISFPKYDPGEEIYPQLFTLLDQGIAHLDSSSISSPGTEDLFYGGDLDQWRKFAKTVKLKMYNQVRLVQNVSSEVNALISDDDLISEGDDFEFPFGTTTTPDDRNPAYVEEWASGNPRNYINPLMFEYMFNLNTFGHRNYGAEVDTIDPRIPYYFYNQMPAGSTDADAENPCSYCPSRSGTAFLSIWSFSFNIDPNEGFAQAVSQTMLGLYPIGGKFDDGSGGAAAPGLGLPNASQRLLTYFARKYVEAELFLTGVATGDARATFEEALNASFDKVNAVASTVSAPAIDDADIQNYINAVLAAYDAADDEGKLEHIITQKWIASFGFGVDAYTDYRRTGYPVLHDGNIDNLPFTVRGRDFPNSFPWVTQNLQINSNAPSQKNVASDAAKVFWMP